jgi:cytoskeletal protein CcmA (bactofilin family)
MATSEKLIGALASTEDLVSIADLMSKIADKLHHTLRAISDLQSVPSEKLYALITEEYGLRTRLGILRGDKTNRIVEGTLIKGDIISQADFRLDGELIGNFQSKGKIVIGPTGSVTGDIICKNADIEGKFNGKIHVAEILNVKHKASIHGEVTVGKLSVEPGADFSASCMMKTNSKNTMPNDGQPKPEEKQQ